MSINYSNNKFGDIIHHGVVIHLTQQAFCDNYGTDGQVAYYAHGQDDAGNDYKVIWQTTAAWDAAQAAATPDEYSSLLDDESNACDWDSYEVVAQ